MRVRTFMLFCCLLACAPVLAWSQTQPEAKAGTSAALDKTKPRLVMVKVPHWKVTFFGLPDELPVLLEPGEPFDPHGRVYDFGAGLQAMEIFLSLRPQDHSAPAFKRFLAKWPLYQKFFKAVDAEQFDEARKLMHEILALDPKEPAVHFYLGSLNTQQGNYAQAEKDYSACLELYPGYGPAYINLARLAMARLAKEEAATYLHQALERTDENDQADSRRLAEQMLKSLETK